MGTKRLTDNLCRTLAEGEYSDQNSRLILRVYASGRRTFSVRHMARRDDGRRYQARRVLGHYPALGLGEARRRAMLLVSDVAAGETDPTVALTFREVAERYMDHCERTQAAATVTQKRNCLNRYLLPLFADRPAHTLTRRDVANLVDHVVDRRANGGRAKVPMANAARRILSAMYGWATKSGYVDGNPVIGSATAGPQYPSTRFLGAEEIRLLWRHLEANPTVIGRLFQLGLTTAQRPGDLRGMRWSEIEGDILRIPAWRYKTRKVHLVPLTPAALAMINEFRGLDRQRPFPVSTVMAARYAQRLCRDLGMQRWTPHVLRKTASDQMARPNLGVLPHIRSAVLGHTLPGMTERHYTEYDYLDERRAALEALEAEIHRLAS